MVVKYVHNPRRQRQEDSEFRARYPNKQTIPLISPKPKLSRLKSTIYLVLRFDVLQTRKL